MSNVLNPARMSTNQASPGFPERITDFEWSGWSCFELALRTKPSLHQHLGCLGGLGGRPDTST